MITTVDTGSSLLWKLGSLKFIGFGAALLGAGIMAVFRPPQTRREVFIQGAVALGASILFGGSIVKLIDFYFPWPDLVKASYEDQVNFTMMVHGLVGALSWGLFGAIAHIRDSITNDPIKAIKEAKDAVL